MQGTTYAQLKRFGRVISAGRRKLGLSQEDFAERCGLFRTYIGKIERLSRGLKTKTSALFARSQM